MPYRGDIKEVPASAVAKPDDILSVDEVAKLCGMTHSRVCQLLRSEQMKGTKWRKIVWQVKRKDAEKFIQRTTPEGRPRVSENGH